MGPPLILTDDVFTSFLKCRYKAYLKLRGEVGHRSDYERMQEDRAARYRTVAMEGLLQRHAGEQVILEVDPICKTKKVPSLFQVSRVL